MEESAWLGLSWRDGELVEHQLSPAAVRPSGRVRLYETRSAVAVVRWLGANDRRLLGMEGLRVDGDDLILTNDHIADLSALDDPAEAATFAVSVLAEWIGSVDWIDLNVEDE